MSVKFEKNAYNNKFQYISYDMAYLEWHVLKLEDSCYVYVEVMIVLSFIFLPKTYFAEGGQEKGQPKKVFGMQTIWFESYLF